MLQIILYNLDIAIEAIKRNKLRSLLTSLGIVFGVASVIAMLAIGNGAQQEILANMQLLGTNNVIIQPVVEQREGEVNEDAENVASQRRFTPGLTIDDIYSIKEQIPHVAAVSPEIIFDTQFIRAGQMRTGKLVGINGEYFGINNFNIISGADFTASHFREAMPVAIIGYGVRTRFFAGEDPIGKTIKAGNVWFTVVGVLEERKLTSNQIENLGIRDYNMDIYVPAESVLLRYRNRALVTNRDVQQAEAESNNNNASGDQQNQNGINYHQLDRAIVQVTDNMFSVTIAEIISRMLKRRHNEVVDFEIIVPELLLQQEQRTKRIFNVVLASIASISLIVGGIGIMNIMLASVVERYREIGVRRAVGAKRHDIQLQFLTEALTISVAGGFVGVILGMSLSHLIQVTADITSIVTLSSIAISFGVATGIGIIFGYYPAKRAARQEPVTALRHE
ncbi:ABC transporter permease [Rhodohalobacter sp. 614A]|uniref:ABC transporter permease n=1 Tax=Rhodohalobacter sp. 614A TaxID=2908649 RepID=UPI001F1D0E74|nr:ABC transporter permease [Rhodohalobacter sp. 614A]